MLQRERHLVALGDQLASCGNAPNCTLRLVVTVWHEASPPASHARNAPRPAPGTRRRRHHWRRRDRQRL